MLIPLSLGESRREINISHGGYFGPSISCFKEGVPALDARPLPHQHWRLLLPHFIIQGSLKKKNLCLMSNFFVWQLMSKQTFFSVITKGLLRFSMSFMQSGTLLCPKLVNLKADIFFCNQSIKMLIDKVSLCFRLTTCEHKNSVNWIVLSDPKYFSSYFQREFSFYNCFHAS